MCVVHGAPALSFMSSHRHLVGLPLASLSYSGISFDTADGPPVVLHSRFVSCPSPVCFHYKLNYVSNFSSLPDDVMCDIIS